MSNSPLRIPRPPVYLAVIWIDWYAYHVARFEGLLAQPELAGHVAGVELVGGIGVHAGLKFREDLPPALGVHTLLPGTSWNEAKQHHLSRLLWNHLTALDPAAVLVPGYYTLPAITAALWARAHHRTSILMTESTAYDHARVAWKEAAKGTLLRSLFDFAVAGGTAHLRYLDQLGFPLDRTGRFYDVVDNAAIARAVLALRSAPPSAEADLPPSPYFLYVGRLAPEKNLELLLSAWSTYRQAGGAWPLVLVGDGPSAPTLRTLAAASPFSADVHFAGLRGSRELPRFYAAAGCFVLPSYREPWGLVVNEAMAAGLPVLVSSQCGSAEDLVQSGRNGFTFDPTDGSALTRHLAAMEEFTVSDRNSMGRQSASHVATYSPQRFGSEIARILRESGQQV